MSTVAKNILTNPNFMKPTELALFALLAGGCNPDMPTPESTPIEDYESDGEGGGEESEAPSDLELLNRERSDIYTQVVSDVLLSDYNGTCRLDFDPAEEEAAQAWVQGGDLHLVTMFNVSENGGPETEWSVVTGLVDDHCRFDEVDDIRDPFDVAMPYRVNDLEGEGRSDVSFKFEECDAASDKLGFIMVPFTYERNGSDIDVQGAVRNPVIGCVEDGELTWIEELAN